MNYTGNSKLTDIMAQYPWLTDELIKIDGRFGIVKTPIGKMMIKNATVSDLSDKTGLSTDDLLKKLQDMIDAHKEI